MGELRVVVIVSKDKSDLYFANQLMQRLNVVGVIVENQHPERDTSPLWKKAMKYAGRPHLFVGKLFGRMGEEYRKRFADYHKPENSANFGEEGRKLFPRDRVEVLYTRGVNNINAPEYIEWLEKLRPDVVAVCGASIFRERLISVPKQGVLNLHGGLAQRYRGLFTTDWAVHNGEPEYVGATVHFVSPGIDDGEIVYQGRPVVEPGDNPHSLYVKVVQLGVNMMTRAVQDIQEDKCRSVAPAQKGKLYLGKMYDSKAMDRAWRRVRQGVIEEYLADKVRRDRPVREMMVNVFPESA